MGEWLKKEVVMPTKEQLQDALTEISQVIDFYKGGFSFQGIYSMREILSEVGVEPDREVVIKKNQSPLTTNGRSGKPRKQCEDESEEEERCILGTRHTMPEQHMKAIGT